jgi:hypothetical protein
MENSAHKVLIEKIIELLKTKPEIFSSRWFTGETLDKSVRCADKNILIMISTGQIVQPFEAIMTKAEKEIVKELMVDIVERDTNYILENFLTKL